MTASSGLRTGFTPLEGTGLGLSIVKNIIEKHNSESAFNQRSGSRHHLLVLTSPLNPPDPLETLVAEFEAETDGSKAENDAKEKGQGDSVFDGEWGIGNCWYQLAEIRQPLLRVPGTGYQVSGIVWPTYAVEVLD